MSTKDKEKAWETICKNLVRKVMNNGTYTESFGNKIIQCKGLKKRVAEQKGSLYATGGGAPIKVSMLYYIMS